ncbi:MAG: hypothetical protein ACLS6O_00475 [Bifidobacterium sp.]
MVRKLLLPSGSRRWITPIVMLLLLLGIIAGAFIVSSVTQRHVQLDDGTVWITSLKDRKAARFNVKTRMWTLESRPQPPVSTWPNIMAAP